MVDLELRALAVFLSLRAVRVPSGVSSWCGSRSDDWMSKAPEDTTVMGAAFADGSGVAATVPPAAASSPAEGVRRWLPGLKVRQDYRGEWLRQDVVAGL